jgi:hypothetical protein
MELQNKDEIRNEILQTWLRSAWVYPFEGPDGKSYLRLTPGGRLKIRRRIGELEEALGVEGEELATQLSTTLPSVRLRDDPAWGSPEMWYPDLWWRTLVGGKPWCPKVAHHPSP